MSLQIKITARELIRKSLKVIGVLGQGENVSDEDAQDGLFTLNMIVDKWNTENLMISATTTIQFPCTGLQVYTFGESGIITSLRPPNGIYNAQYVDTSNYYQKLQILSRQQWDDLGIKESVYSSTANYVYYNATYPNSELYVYPQPTEGQFILTCSEQFLSFDSLDTIIDLPSGYINALVYSLATFLAPEYGKAVEQNILEFAIGAKNTIKTTNGSQKMSLLRVDNALIRRAGFDIRTGE